MVPKPQSITLVGIVQTLLASAFVIWLIFFPSSGVNFAWPISPEPSAMFIGAGFLIRAYLGYHLWRERHWYRLRWQVWGNYAFLAVLLVGTFWHVNEMNWFSNIWIAHVWVVAYIVEPLVLPLYEPRGEAAKAPIPDDLQEGPIFPGLKRILLAAYVVGISLGLLLFIHPAFMNTRWAWALDPFDARIMAAFPIMAGLWALYGYLAKDWAEIKSGVLGILILSGGLFAIWLFNLPRLDLGRENVYQTGIITGAFAVLLAYYYIRQERAKPGQAAA